MQILLKAVHNKVYFIYGTDSKKLLLFENIFYRYVLKLPNRSNKIFITYESILRPKMFAPLFNFIQSSHFQTHRT